MTTPTQPAQRPSDHPLRLGRAGRWRFAAACCLSTLAACSAQETSGDPAGETPGQVRASDVVIAAPESVAKPPFAFAPADEALLDEIQHAAFLFLWNECSPHTGMVYDRSSKNVVSIAGVGFQLSAIPIAIERGWVTADEGRARALQIVKALHDNPANRVAGLFFHYLDEKDAGPSDLGYEHAVSTIDSALLFGGLITASSYFGGEIGEHCDAMLREADWSFFVSEGQIDPRLDGYIALAWKPHDREGPSTEGKLSPHAWVDAGDEHRLVTFLAACAPEEDHRVDPALYYRLRRTLGKDEDCGMMVWFPWSGALFVSFFAHCWIDYAHLGPDDPALFHVEHRPRVDWWENARRTVCLHREKAIRNPLGLPGLGPVMWGLSASDAPEGYRVPGVFPEYMEMTGSRAEIDYPEAARGWEDRWLDGTVAPYAAGCSVMFSPEEAVSALRHLRELKTAEGKPWVWRDPAEGGYGFLDALNVGKAWVATDYIAIDQGPLVLAIENARTGRVWGWFHAHPFVQEGVARLRLAESGGEGE